MNHIYSIDLLRGIAAFGIIGCHLMLYPKTGEAAALTGLCDMFVGLFAALSGFLMGVKGNFEIPGDRLFFLAYIRKRAMRILPAYCFWTFVYIVFGLIFDMAVRNALSEKWFAAGFWMSTIFLGGASCHLWFLVCLFYCQITLGALLFAIKKIKWQWMLAAGFALIIVAGYSSAELWWTFYPLRLFAFLVSGNAVAHMSDVLRRDRLGLWVIALVAGGIAHYAFSGILPQFVRDYFVALPLLIVFAKLLLPGRLSSLAGILGKTSMGVFLVHPIFAAGFGLAFKKSFSAPFGVVPWCIDWLCCWGGALLATLFLFRFPCLKKVSS